ncbi:MULTISPECIES: DNA repair protein RecN [Croceitalea]|uniref:DNA repair protein RecN n=1 Tax=Croceitalea vernalis TaxID=3075599 RepID=A0ABU3BHZ8_9FLAO|nr:MULTISPECIES: DNA repair protein RecN [unclassified Croceitalea]MDT0539976.1 DNA repair protein RecN [Croceitalea sp. P059]MDT0621796.1 DNA repair protein RecN [Croceitalea sp. P007]
MLTHLSIKNYALIDELNVSFTSGFTTITGETGAGKSILLGGLSLVLGKRADLSSLKNKEAKCIIEAEFAISNYGLKSYFEINDLDYAATTWLRREILPSGKSRAFVNDTPVTLDILSGLGAQLVDIHSQHQTLRLTENDFQFRVIDALAENQKLIEKYTVILAKYKGFIKDLEELRDFERNASKELDYNSFLLEELEKATLKDGILEALEEEYDQLSNVERIIELLSQSGKILNDEQIGLLSSSTILQQASQKLSDYGKQFTSLNERVQSIAIELTDIASELESLQEDVEANPNRLEEVNGQLQLLHDLFKKHQVSTVIELEEIKIELSEKVDSSLNIDAKIKEKENLLASVTIDLNKLASAIHSNRNRVIPQLKELLTNSLSNLGMPSASFKIEIEPTESFKVNGKDNLIFLFSANKGYDYGELKKVASGGELSRIMLTIKSVLANYEQLPTLMFDEIDTGVSGEISSKMGDIMQKMGSSMQVFSITHLPQVASKGASQFKVFKEETGESTRTDMRKLTNDERVNELAEMLGGKNLSDSALAHARQLLQ